MGVILVIVFFVVVFLWYFIIKDKILMWMGGNIKCKICGEIISSHRVDQLCDRCRHNGHT